MTTSRKPNANERSFPEPPMFFADQPAALMLGPVVSRITFGAEEMDDGQFPRPVVTIALPTVALLQFVNDVKAALDDTHFKKQSIKDLLEAAKIIQDGGITTPKTHRIDVRAQNRRSEKKLQDKRGT